MIPPQSPENEKAVIGTIALYGRRFFDRVEDILAPEMFWKPAHKMVFEAFIALVGRNEAIDMTTLPDQLTKNGTFEEVGGAYGLTLLIDDSYNSANIEYYAGVVREMWLRREQIIIAMEHQARAYNLQEDIFETIDGTGKKLQELVGVDSGLESATDLFNQMVKKIEHAEKRRADAEKAGTPVITGIPYGFDKMDREYGGFENTDLIIIAGRPAMGKTHFVLALMMSAARFGFPVLFFSLEMGKIQILERMASFESKVNTRDMRQGNMDADKWKAVNGQGSKVKGIWIDDKGAVTPAYVRSRVKSAKKTLLEQWRKENPKKKVSEFRMLVAIDYIQLMTATGSKKGGNREQEVSSITRDLKALAKEADCPIVALSQLSRSVETRGGDKKPMLSDLRESGAIEQDADMVMFCYRPEYYGLLVDEEGHSTVGMGEIIVAKYRHGRIGPYQLGFTGAWGWSDPDKSYNGGESSDLGMPKIQPNNKFFSEPQHSEEQPSGGGDNFPF